ncbi:MAG: UDP-N-acetylmuramoyl-tripeptide--D-alanyl-D-alanine ligase [Bdellovibrionota bacterium]
MADQFFTVDELVKMTKGKLLQKQDSFVYGISTDSRTIQKGDLFIPLKGENFDGHDYVAQVVEKGAAAALVSQDLKEKVGITLIKVDDTLKALQDMGSSYRHAYPFKIIGITGSNGKTTTKFFTEKILSQQFRTYASQKSFNNHFGVPLTLLALKPDTQFGIVEIGMNHAGEISALTKMADPDIALVTTVGRAHLMDFDGVEGIAKEKSDIYRKSRGDNIKVFNLDNDSTAEMYREFKGQGHAITFSSVKKDVDVHFELKEMGLEHLRITGAIKGVPGEVVIPVFGAHNVINLMGAAGIALAAGMTPENIWSALPSCQTVWGRNMLVHLKSKANLIFDGYNANPDSMKALVDNLSQLTVDGKKIVILGDMLEMGEQADELHSELGEFIGRKGFEVVWFLGQFSKSFEAGIKKSQYSKNLFISNGYEESLAVKVASMVEPSDIVVMKGSRGARLEKLVPHFQPVNWNV